MHCIDRKELLNSDFDHALTPSPRLDKIEASIGRMKNMFDHMDSIWMKYNTFKRQTDAAVASQEPESTDRSNFKEASRESDLVTLLNLEDYNP
jgi:hypothetical protein